MIAGELSTNISAGDSGFRKNIPEVSDAPGASPRRCGAPVAMTSYYLYTKNETTSSVMQGNHMRPQRGYGCRKGGSHSQENKSLHNRKNLGDFPEIDPPAEQVLHRHRNLGMPTRRGQSPQERKKGALP